MYRYKPPARVVYAAIVANGSSICIFKNPPTDAQGELMAAALDPANVIVSRERLAELTAAEQRNAELEARSKLTNVELANIARNAALNSTIRYSYMPCLPDDAYGWEPHWWVIEAMRAALKPTESGASE